MIDSPAAQFAVEVVREAALLVREIQSELVTPALTKDDRSPVTVADFAAQALVARRLLDRFPDQVMVGEESAAALRDAEAAESLMQIAEFVARRIPDTSTATILEWIDRGAGEPPASYWTLDPVDGTKGFLRGDQYAVALGYVENGKVEIGALGCPQLSNGYLPDIGGTGTLALAVRGRGTYCTALAVEADWSKLEVSDRDQPADARLLRSVESAHTNTGEIGQLVERLSITASPVPMDSQAKYSVLASGKGDVLVRLLSKSRPDYREKIWDQAAGSIVIEEAGGRITDLDGQPLDFSQGRTLAKNRGILATNGHLHDAMLAALQAIGA